MGAHTKLLFEKLPYSSCTSTNSDPLNDGEISVDIPVLE